MARSRGAGSGLAERYAAGEIDLTELNTQAAAEGAAATTVERPAEPEPKTSTAEPA